MPDFDVVDSKGRPMTITFDRQPTPAEIELAAAAQFGPEPTFGSRLGESASRLGEGVMSMISHPLKTVTRLTGRDPDAIYNDYQAGRTGAFAADVLAPEAMSMKQNLASAGEAVRHPLKTVTRFLGGDPEAMTEDIKARRVGALAGDVAIPAMMALGPKVVAKGAQTIGPMLESAGERWWTGAAKPTLAALRKTTTMQQGGTEAEAARQVARTNLKLNRGTLVQSNVRAAERGLDALDTQLSAAIANSSATIPRTAIEQALLDEGTRVGVGTLGRAQQQRALSAAFDELQKLPDHIPIQEAQQLKQSIYAAREASYAADAATTAAAAADKVTGRALRGQIAQAAPDTADINAQFQEQIPALSALGRGVQRAGNRNPVGLPEMLALAKGKPTVAIAAAMNHPTTGSWLAQRLFNTGQALSGLSSGDAYRAALIARLMGQNQGQ